MPRYIARPSKHPLETESYDFPFADYLTEHADTLASFEVEFDAGIGISTAIPAAILADATTVRVFVYAGEDGNAYDVAVAGTTAAGRVHRLTMLVKVKGEGVAEGVPVDGGDVDTEYVEPPLDDGDIDV